MLPLPHAFHDTPSLAAFIKRVGPCPLNFSTDTPPKQSPYEALVQAVVGQQLHNVAAERIFARLCALSASPSPSPSTPPEPALMATFSDETLRQCGLSFAKINTLRSLAQARQEGLVPSLKEAQKLDDEALISRLTTLKGIGRWTVEMMLLFTLHRPDILPAGDYGVQEGWRRLNAEPKRLTPKKLRDATAPFAPRRSTLTWYCWQAKALLPEPSFPTPTSATS